MISDRRCVSLLGIAGSLSSAGYWPLIVYMIENHFVDALVATPANISEDIIDALGDADLDMLEKETGLELRGIDWTFRKVSPHNVDDKKLQKLRYDRFYDHVISEDAYVAFESIVGFFMADLNSRLQEKVFLPGFTFIELFARWLKRFNVSCIITTAVKHGVPVICPSLSDSGYLSGYIRAFKDVALDGRNFSIDHMLSGELFTKALYNLSADGWKTGALFVGGAVPKNYIQSTTVFQTLFCGREEPIPHRYAAQINVDPEYYGGLSGASLLTESISWGKESEESIAAETHCDFTIALPYLINYLREAGSSRRSVRCNLNNILYSSLPAELKQAMASAGAVR